jgi:hypothetical protein
MQSILVDHLAIGREVVRVLQPLSPLARMASAHVEMMQDVVAAVHLAMCTTPQHPKLTPDPRFQTKYIHIPGKPEPPDTTHNNTTTNLNAASTAEINSAR